MASYTLDNLLDEAGATWATTNKGDKSLLREVWAALDKYAASCLEQRQGLVVPNLCRIGWSSRIAQQEVAVDGASGLTKIYRPYFQIAESFSRAYRAEPPPTASPPVREEDLCIFEDLNLSKAAIRFSNQLTKDQVSGGLRVLVRHIGEAFQRGRQLSIEFSFGELVSSERFLDFAFASHILAAAGLEGNMKCGPASARRVGRAPATFGRGPSEDVLESLSMVGSGIGDSSSSVSSASKRRHNGAATSGKLVQQRREGPAFEDAMHRRITELEVRASEAMRDKAEREALVQKNVECEFMAFSARRREQRQMAEALERQIEEKGRRQAADVTFEEAAGADAQESHEAVDLGSARHAEASRFPPANERKLVARNLGEQISVLSAPEYFQARNNDEFMACKNEDYRQALDEQLKAKKEQQDAMKRVEQNLDAQLAEAHAKRAMHRSVREQEVRERDREELLAAWRDENRLREIREQVEAVERGKRPPASKCGLPVAGGTGAAKVAVPALSLHGSGLDSRQPTGLSSRLPGATSSRGTSSRVSTATPRSACLSARGSSLGAAASLALHTGPAEFA